MATQGQGDSTPWKVDGFATVFHVSLDIGNAEKLRKWAFWHLDLNAGCGWNDKAGCEGSPISFLRVASQFKRPIRAYFCDKRQEACDALAGRIPPLSLPGTIFTNVVCCDNAALLGEIAKQIRRCENPEYAIGQVLCDPNGFNDMPLDALAAFAAEFPRIDVIIHLNISLFARMRGCKKSEQYAKGFGSKPEPEDVLRRLGRKWWSIRRIPSRKGMKGERFTTAVGTSFKNRSRRIMDFVDLESDEGQSIVKQLKSEDPKGQMEFAFVKEIGRRWSL